jgi:pilus assembly protein Flp/PilA
LTAPIGDLWFYDCIDRSLSPIQEGSGNMCRLLRFIREEQAATAVEYAVMLALILLAMIGTIKAIGSTSGGMWSDNYGKMKSAGF